MPSAGKALKKSKRVCPALARLKKNKNAFARSEQGRYKTKTDFYKTNKL